MIIGVPREIKQGESRVGLLPASVREIAGRGHEVLVESGAGTGCGFSDEAYTQSGARIVPDSNQVFAEAELIVKVKEPQPGELERIRSDQTLFAYLHLAAFPELAAALLEKGTPSIAFETVTDAGGRLPCLTPSSEVAGRLALMNGVGFLSKPRGGKGLLIGGIPGVSPGRVTIIGGGVAGTGAARMALGLEARVTVMDTSVDRLRELSALFGPRLVTVKSGPDTVDRHVREADLVLTAVLVPGEAAPKLISRELVRSMEPGSVIVDVAIDQGGACETSRPTTHAEPVYESEGVIHYCVSNIPGSVPRTAAVGLNNAILPFVLELADRGIEDALRNSQHLRAGLNLYGGAVTHAAVAGALGRPFTAPDSLL